VEDEPPVPIDVTLWFPPASEPTDDSPPG